MQAARTEADETGRTDHIDHGRCLLPRAWPPVAHAALRTMDVVLVEGALLAALPPLLLLLQASLNVPQLVRLVRSRDGGVPLSGEAMSLALGVGWLLWAVVSAEPAMVASSVLALLGYGPTTWVLLRRGHPWRLAGSLVAIAGLVQLVGTLVGGLSLLATVLTAAAVVQYGAYVAAAVRCTDWSGYSPVGGAMRIAFGLGWAVYGQLAGRPPLVVWGMLTAVTFTVTFALARRARTSTITPTQETRPRLAV